MNTDKIKNLLIPYDIDYAKKRYGCDGDGGYVLIEDFVEETINVYSLGISTEYNIDVDLSKMGKKVYQYDKIDCNVPQIENIFFKKMFVDKNNLYSELNHTGGLESNKNLLLMDIEGSEIDILCDTDLLKHFSQICLELHYVLSEPRIIQSLESLNMNHTLVHIHANNWCISEGHQNHIKKRGMVDDLPDILELTYVRNDLITKKSISTKSVPTEFDRKNYNKLPEIEMSWWIK